MHTIIADALMHKNLRKFINSQILLIIKKNCLNGHKIIDSAFSVAASRTLFPRITSKINFTKCSTESNFKCRQTPRTNFKDL